MDEVIYYSHVEDDFSNSSEDIEEAALNALEYYLEYYGEEERETVEVLTLFKGLSVRQTFDKYLSVNSIIDEMQNLAFEYCGEYAEKYLDDVSEEQKKELENLIISWAERHGIEPDWCMVENIEEIKYKIPDDFDRN